jgi:hypothetical protein
MHGFWLDRRGPSGTRTTIRLDSGKLTARAAAELMTRSSRNCDCIRVDGAKVVLAMGIVAAFEVVELVHRNLIPRICVIGEAP